MHSTPNTQHDPSILHLLIGGSYTSTRVQPTYISRRTTTKTRCRPCQSTHWEIEEPGKEEYIRTVFRLCEVHPWGGLPDDNGEPDGRDEQECRTQNKNEQRTRRDGHHDKQRAQQTASNHRVVGGKNHFGDEHMQGGTGDETLTWKNKKEKNMYSSLKETSWKSFIQFLCTVGQMGQ